VRARARRRCSAERGIDPPARARCRASDLAGRSWLDPLLRIGRDGFISLPSIKTEPGLLAGVTSRDELTKDLGRLEASPVELAGESFRDRETHVETDQIARFQRPHLMSVPELHGTLDILGGSDALLDHPHGFEPQRHAEARRRKTR